MKNSIKMVLVVLTIVMSFVAVQAFGGIQVNNGPGAPNVSSELEVVSGCVLSLEDGAITLCSETQCSQIVNCGCLNENKITILGIGPVSYWADCTTLVIGSDGTPDYEEGEGYDVIAGTFNVAYPKMGDYVTIGYYTSLDGNLIALWVVVGTGDDATAVLLRDQDTLDVLWKEFTQNMKEEN